MSNLWGHGGQLERDREVLKIYQNITTAAIFDMSRKTFIRDSGKKNQVTTRTNEIIKEMYLLQNEQT